MSPVNAMNPNSFPVIQRPKMAPKRLNGIVNMTSPVSFKFLN